MKVKAGFTLLEVVISIVMVSILAISIYPLISWLKVKSTRYAYLAQSGELLQEGVEAVYNLLLQPGGWESLTSDTEYDLAIDGDGKWTLVTDKMILRTRFYRTIKATAVCRNPSTGELGSDCTTAGGNEIDANSRYIWVDVRGEVTNNNIKPVEASLLVTKFER